MAWVVLVIAGLLEVVWATAMKQSYGFSRPIPSVVTIAGMLASFGLLSYAMRTLALGNAYMVWTGIGAVGSFLVGVFLLGESVSPLRIAAAVLVVSGIILMTVASPS